MNTVEDVNFVEMCITFAFFALAIGVCFYGFVASMNRRVQLRKIAEIEKNADVFIREFHFVEIDETTDEVVHCISYQPHYKRPVCGKGQEVILVDEPIMLDFPRGTDWRNLEQVNTLLVFWKRQRDLKANKKYADRPLATFRSEAEKNGFWEQFHKEQANRDLSIF